VQGTGDLREVPHRAGDAVRAVSGLPAEGHAPGECAVSTPEERLMFAEPILPFFLLHPGRVTDGDLLTPAGLRVRDRDGFQSTLNRLAGRSVVVALIEATPQAPNPMRYYRGCVVPIIATEYVGTGDYEAVHDEIAHKFLGLPPDPETGARRRRSTAHAAMSDEEFRWFLQQVIEWATLDCGLVIPPPDAVGYRYEIPEAA